ncbi:MAG: FAD:protein FMN transferase [Alphaproteobacteria bacterium]|nr:FAD:protein FMN transferase [Alphaproteobacteria bacterium]
MRDFNAVTRRRVLRIAASAAGLALAPGVAGYAAAATGPQRWEGVALGADASITLYHPDPSAGGRALDAAVAELRRLEKVFSLYRADSALSQLNRDGALDAPPPELLRLLAEARRYSEITGGAFDVTVQPLWRLYADHFAAAGADSAGPAAADIGRALALVDYRAVTLDTARIALDRPGMAVTLNGIAQGFVTDRVADMLRGVGLENVLVDLGEMRALGTHPDGRPWNVGIKDPFVPDGLAARVPLANRAIATSGGYGLYFDAAGRHHHLLDPRRGISQNRYASLSVLAPTATRADALSTALFNLDEDAIGEILSRMAEVEAIVIRSDGTAVRV